MTPAEIDARRVEQRVCRHCGGPVPCWSSFGDRAPGKQHTRGSFEMMKQGATAEGARFVRQDLDSRRGTGVG